MGARPAPGSRPDPGAAALPRLADGEVGVRHLPRAPGGVRRGDGAAAPRPALAARLPGPARRPEHARVAGDRACPAAVHHRRLERDAHRGPVGRPRGEPDQRPVGDDPVRRLPGRGHAGRPPGPGRRSREDQRQGPARAGDGPLARRVLGPRGRAGAARVARRVHPRPPAGRPGRPGEGVPGPRRPAGAGGARAQGHGARPAGQIPAWHQTVAL